MTIKNVAIVLAIVFATTNAVPYSKFGRSCKDIGCRSDEVCVMAEEPCSYSSQRDQCGRYPTCKRTNTGGESCTTKQCPSGTYCRTENGQPTCVNTNSGLGGYESAGVGMVNGQKSSSGQQQPAVPADPYGSRYANGNPYENANAPPASEVNGNRYNNPPPSNNNGYPAYPSSNNNNGYPSSNNNNGYPPYPSSNNNNGYPPYPSNNNNNYRPSNDHYGTSRQPNLPQLNPGWGNVYPGSVYNRRNGATANGASKVILLIAISLIGCLRIIKA